MKKRNVIFFVSMLLLIAGTGNAANEKRTDKPNVLFISVDDLNDWVSLLGKKGNVDIKTPNLDKLARRGVYFVNNHANTTACSPSRLSVMTGMSAVSTGCYTNKSGVQNKQLYDNVLPLPCYLRNNGYYTMGCGKIEGHAMTDFDKKHSDNKMWNERLPRSFRMNSTTFRDGGGYGGIDFYPFPIGGSGIKNYHPTYRGHSLCAGPIDRDYLPGGKMPDEISAEWIIKRLKRNYDKPFFLGIGFVRPHVPYTAPREFFDMYPLNKIHAPADPEGEMDDISLYGKAMAYGLFEPGDEFMVREMGPDYRKKLVQGYMASVSFMDAQLGLVLDALEESKYAKNTIIVLWSDHGQHLGEKHSWRKQCLWQESTNCPMIWVVPNVAKAGAICKQPSSLLDIYPTLTELCGLKKIENQDGISLLSQIKNSDTKSLKPAITTWTYGSHSVRGERYHYIHYYDGSDELYDGENDFGEHNNLANDPNYVSVIKKMKKYLPKDIYKPTERNKEFYTYKKRAEQWKKDPESMPDWLK